MKKTKLLIFLAAALIVVCSFAACGEDVNTPKTSVLTTESSIQTEAETTPAETSTIVTSTLDETTTPETTEVLAWMAKIESNLFEKAVEEDGKYYIYLTYRIKQDGYAIHDNETFVDAYVADRDDLMFANLKQGTISQGIFLRATAEEIEVYAKNTYVTGIYSYPADKVIDGCKATVERMDGRLLIEKMYEIANGGGSLPLVKVSCREELMAFAEICILDDRSYLDEMGWTEIQSSREQFAEMTAVYDDAYFAEKTLFLIGSVNSTGSEQFSLIHVLNDDGVQIVLEMTRPVMITMDMAWWLIFVEVENSAISDQTSFSVIVK